MGPLGYLMRTRLARCVVAALGVLKRLATNPLKRAKTQAAAKPETGDRKKSFQDSSALCAISWVTRPRVWEP